jgi:NarL family two-component system response regulator YdfI
MSDEMTSKGPASTILLIDDHTVIRHGLRTLIESALGHRVLEAGSAEEGVALLQSASIDLVLVDARMPGEDGISFLKRSKTARPGLPVIVLSTYDTEEYVSGALENGASGYVLKDSTFDQLREAIDTALLGKGTYLSPLVAQRLWARTRKGHAASNLDLSERELEVLSELVAGARNIEIAQNLYLSVKTVKSHLGSIFRKLEVTNRTEAVSKAIREGLVSLPSKQVAS